MSLDEDIRILSSVDLFKGFTSDQLRLIAFGSQKTTYSQGSELFYEGAIADGGYVVISGTVELVAYSDQELDILGQYEAGSLIGEMALISENKRMATALVKSDAVILKISREVMHRVLEEYPEVAALLYRRIMASLETVMGDLEKVHTILSR